MIKNILKVIGFLGLATGICALFRNATDTGTHVALIYVLAVLLTARFTDGYVYGVVTAVAAVVCVNYIYTYPYFEMNFTITGYPVTFFVMLTVAIMMSALMTQIKKQEQIKREIEKEKMRANLLRAVSHDIRTPLTSIAGSTAVILENEDILSKEKIVELVGNIGEEAQWLVRIVENLLSITRINSEKAHLETQEEIAEDVVSGTIVKFNKRFPEIKVSANIPEEVLFVPMDCILIEQVILNIMENAVLHGKTTSKISIMVKEENQKAVFKIEDDGEGIKENILPVIFDGTIGARNGESEDAKRNMGIGLSVCQSIIKAHKGTLTAENRESGGARFTFMLPLTKEEN